MLILCTFSAKLNSCLEEMRNILGDTVPEHIMIEAVLRADFHYEKALNDLLNAQGSFCNCFSSNLSAVVDCLYSFVTHFQSVALQISRNLRGNRNRTGEAKVINFIG